MGKSRHQKKQPQCQMERMPAGSPSPPPQSMPQEMNSVADGMFKGSAEVVNEGLNEMESALDEMLVDKKCKLDACLAECEALRTRLKHVAAQFVSEQHSSMMLAKQVEQSDSQNKLLASSVDRARDNVMKRDDEIARIIEIAMLEKSNSVCALKAMTDLSASLSKQLEESKKESRLEILQHMRKAENCDAQMDKLQEIAKESVAQWHWSSGDENQWHSFDMAANPELECAYQSQGGHGTFPLQSGMHFYDINFDDMSQTNTGTGRKRSIRRKVFGVQDTDPLKVVQLVLAARAQEIEALRVQLPRVQAEVEALRTREDELRLHLANRDDELEDLSARLAEQEEELTSVKAVRDELQAAFNEAQASASALQADVQKMQDKARGTQAYLIDAERAQQAAEARLHQVEGELTCALTENKRVSDEASVSHAAFEAKLAHVTEERNALKRQSSEKDHAVGAAVRSFTELWKARLQEARKCEESNVMVTKVANLFKGLSHKGLFKGRPSRCQVFQQMQVKSVHSLHNPRLWLKYTHRKEEVQNEHTGSGIKALPLLLQDLNALIEGVKLDAGPNEVFLAHGCSETAAHGIMQGGFDVRYTNSHGGSLYGEGIYFSTQLCKCHQYTDAHQASGQIGHIIIARVVLGDPCMLKGQYDGRLPPLRVETDPSKGRYDSNAIDPAVSTRGQAHWEYVVFDGAQAYPEMLVTYTIP